MTMHWEDPHTAAQLVADPRTPPETLEVIARLHPQLLGEIRDHPRATAQLRARLEPAGGRGPFGRPGSPAPTGAGPEPARWAPAAPGDPLRARRPRGRLLAIAIGALAAAAIGAAIVFANVLSPAPDAPKGPDPAAAGRQDPPRPGATVQSASPGAARADEPGPGEGTTGGGSTAPAAPPAEAITPEATASRPAPDGTRSATVPGPTEIKGGAQTWANPAVRQADASWRLKRKQAKFTTSVTLAAPDFGKSKRVEHSDDPFLVLKKGKCSYSPSRDVVIPMHTVLEVISDSSRLAGNLGLGYEGKKPKVSFEVYPVTGEDGKQRCMELKPTKGNTATSIDSYMGFEIVRRDGPSTFDKGFTWTDDSFLIVHGLRTAAKTDRGRVKILDRLFLAPQKHSSAYSGHDFTPAGSNKSTRLYLSGRLGKS